VTTGKKGGAPCRVGLPVALTLPFRKKETRITVCPHSPSPFLFHMSAVKVPANSAEPPASFESAMERLETIVEQMENARLPLEELIRCYEEGTRLIQTCSERLSAAEQRIEIITRDAAGQPRASEFQPAALASAPAPASDSPKTKTPNSKAADVSISRAAARSNDEVSLF
jgi:exodeoxyribonuclease VII small subunit